MTLRLEIKGVVVTTRKRIFMKALIILAIFLTIGSIFFKYRRDKNLKKLLISLITFVSIVSLAIMGNLTRPVMPLFIVHEILIIIAWGALFMYIFKQKYCWWWFSSPLVTIGLFLLLEFLEGSRHGIFG